MESYRASIESMHSVLRNANLASSKNFLYEEIKRRMPNNKEKMINRIKECYQVSDEELFELECFFSNYEPLGNKNPKVKGMELLENFPFFDTLLDYWITIFGQETPEKLCRIFLIRCCGSEDHNDINECEVKWENFLSSLSACLSQNTFNYN
ncbi:hypothetical protein SteCoe_3457 [Stentor coeruleus]|uniref:Uncharacterized protein n=1 Tax=Stentor coeruleus TaxID=5963 RepID=A0A1R2CWV4_9CILI|nr:hypothetical protein SteCoe_3457 [Stentor coeruleus]